MTENEISYIIRGCIFEVYNELGPGLLESAYQAALAYELRQKGLTVREEVPLPMIYKKILVDRGYRIDMLVEAKVIVENKSVEFLPPVSHNQILTHLRLSGLRLGLLVNFNTNNIAENIFRKVNNL
jgi:GxxExxY protein